METKKIVILIAFAIALLVTVSSALAAPTGLEITDLKIGKTGGTLVSYQNDTDTAAFSPGDEIKIELTAKNSKSFVMVNIEETTAGSDAKLTGVKSEETTAQTLDPNQEDKLYTYKYKIPASITEGKYLLKFNLEGHQKALPSNKFTDSHSVKLKVEQKLDNVYIEEVINLNDADKNSVLSCDENKDKTKIRVKLINNGKEKPAGTKVKVVLSSPALEKDLVQIKTVKLESTNPGGLKVYFTSDLKDLVGEESFTVKVHRADYVKQIYDEETFTIKGENCALSFKTTTPEGDKVTVKDGEAKDFVVDVENPGNVVLNYEWYLDGSPVGTNSPTYKFSKSTAGEYEVKIQVNGDKPTKTWTVTVADRPVDMNQFPGSGTTDLTGKDITKVEKFVLENSNAKVEFTGNAGKVDLSKILKLAEVVKIQDGLVAVDSNHVDVKNTGLEKGAKITLKKTFNKPVIQKSDKFNTGTFTKCTVGCTVVSNGNGKFVFTVDSFSTYQVVEETAAAFSISEVVFKDAKEGETVTKQITIKNIGTVEKLTDVKVEHDLGSEYNAVFTDGLSTEEKTLDAGEEASVTLQVKVDGSGNIGTLKVTGTSNGTVEKTAPIVLQTKSFLTIRDIDFDEIKLGEDFEIKVEIKNDYDEDMKDVEVTVRILDGSSEIAEKDEEIRELKDGDKEDFTFKFDLSNEDLDENSYTIEVTVKGEAEDDNSRHETVDTKDVDVDREKHNVIIQKMDLSPSFLQCSINKRATLEVDIENVGEEDEDDVEVRVRNSDLNIDLKKSNIDLDDYSGNDNDYTARFNLLIDETATDGTYPLTVEVYRDNSLEDKDEIELKVDCLAAKPTDSVNTYGTLNKELQQKLADYVAKKDSLSNSFRDSDNYVMLLGVMVVLVFVAVILSLAVLFIRKK